MPKTNKIGIMQYDDSMPLSRLVDYLTANHFAAVISPEHKDDEWTAEEVKNWRKSQETLHGVYIKDGALTWECPTGEERTNEIGALVRLTETKPVPQVGQVKKKHRHVYIELDYSATVSVWLNLLAPLGVSYVEPIKSKRAYLRYLCHLDNPEKAQYRPEDVISLGGVDISCIWEKTQRDIDNLELRILDVITVNKIKDVTRLQRTLLEDSHDMEAYREVKAHYGYWTQYMRGLFFVTTVEVKDLAPRRLGVDADGVVVDDVA